MKKLFYVLLVVALGLGLCACGRPSAESVVQEELDLLKSGDQAAYAEFMAAADSETDTADLDDEISQAAMQAVFGGLSYQIIDSVEDEAAGTATVTAEVTNTDMVVAMSNVFSEILPILLEDAFKPESEQMTEEESTQMVSDKLLETLQNPEREMTTTTVDIKLDLVDDAWVIAEDNDAFLNAVLGGMYDFANDLEESFSF